MNEQKLGYVKDWHNPHNEDCSQNQDVYADCTCKRPRIRKPYRAIKVTDNGVGHRVNPLLIFEIYPDGTFNMREAGRKKRFSWNTADLYRHLMWRSALAYQNAKRKARKERRLARKAVRK